MKKTKKGFPYDYSPLLIAGVYVVVSILWIVYSDKVVEILSANSRQLLIQLQTLKGGFFVVATGIMLYFLIKSRLKVIKQSEHHYRTLFEFAGDGVFIYSRSGIIDCNQHALKLFDCSDKKEIIGKHFYDLSPPVQADGGDFEKLCREKTDNALKGNPQIFEWQYRNLKGDVITGSVSFSLLDEESGTLVAILHDITEIKLIQEKLQHYQKMKVVGQLAGGVAHDFNNILSAILGYADMALDEVKDENPVSEYIQNILKAGNRAEKLVSQILTFSRQGSDEKRSVRLKPIILEVLELLKASLPSTVKLDSLLSDDTMPVFADSDKIHEVLMNLAANSVHAMDEKGKLTFVLYEEKNNSILKGIIGPVNPGFYSVIEVRDTGHGIEDSVLSRIFDPFFTTKRNMKGTGLGLSVVYGVMQSHGGNIQIESVIGEGTVFRLFFPKTDKAEEAEKQKDENISEGNERILLVDDEEILVDLGKSMLSSLGYKVRATTDSLEALQLLQDSINDYDILITDQTMPNLTGIELAEKIHKNNPGFPIILCTGFSSRVDEEKAEKAGCRGFLKKPATRQEFTEMIRNIFDSKE